MLLFPTCCQALSDRDLVLLNRDHDLETGFRALELSLRLLPEETSVDLIFGRPGQTPEKWAAELERMMRMFPLSHVSLYELTLERGKNI